MKIQQRGFCCVGLDFPKNSLNIGSALRACGIFGVDFLAVSGKNYKRAPTDAMKAYRHVPLLRVDSLKDVIPFDCVPVAVELLPEARSLCSYIHPERAFYIFGPEDGTLGSRVVSWCRDVVYVPTNGCMNLAAAVNVILYDRMAKRIK
jgi:tRNA(Leu) C34 or U34 (ribose-2'-O)-methylase TrmL